MPEKIFQIIYLSRCTELLLKNREKELFQIIAIAKKNNKSLGITGILLHHSDYFIQLLEGREASVKELYACILQDKRHQNISTLIQRHSEERFFEDWSMKLKMIEPVDEKSLRLTYAWDGIILNFKNRIAIPETKICELFQLAT